MPDAVEAFLVALEPAARAADARRLHAIFSEVTGFPARLWPAGIIGYGRYAYRYDSGRTGESLATGFSPRKAEHVVYIMPGYGSFGDILAGIGPHRMGKSCLYFNRLDRRNEDALRRLIRAGLDDPATRWTVEPA
jgi:hypothetical protein